MSNLMKKRGQITYFLILGLMLVIVAGFIIYVRNINVKKPNIEKPSESADTDIVKSYAETCIKIIAEEALFSKIGPQGGYINPKSQPNIDSGKSRYNSDPIQFEGKSVPYFLEELTINGDTRYYTFIPTLDSIEKKLENQIKSEFDNCFDSSIFKDKGIVITEPIDKNKVKVSVNANREDVSINFQYPLIVKKGTVQSNLDEFSLTLPIRLRSLHEWASKLVEDIKNKQPQEYYISANCNFDKKGLTNIYLDDIPEKGQIIRIVDFSTYFQKYLKSFDFQFAVKDVHINGKCSK